MVFGLVGLGKNKQTNISFKEKLTLCLLHQCRPLHTCRKRWRKVRSVCKHSADFPRVQSWRSNPDIRTIFLYLALLTAWETELWYLCLMFSLVGGVIVADHLRQDPLLVSVRGLHPRRHLVALLGHVVAAGWSRSAQRRRADGEKHSSAASQEHISCFYKSYVLVFECIRHTS